MQETDRENVGGLKTRLSSQNKSQNLAICDHRKMDLEVVERRAVARQIPI